MIDSEILANDLPEIELQDPRKKRPYSRREMESMAGAYASQPTEYAPSAVVPDESTTKQSMGMKALNAALFVLSLPGRPVKAVLNAHHEVGELMMDEVESLGHGIPLLTMAKDYVPRVAGAFLAGLRGEGGAKEFLKDLGVKGLSKEELEAKMADSYETHKVKNKLGFVGDIAWGVMETAKHSPADLLGDAIDDSVAFALLPAGIAKGAAKYLKIGHDLKMGKVARANLVAKVGEEGADKVFNLIDEVSLPGGGGYEGFLQRLKELPPELQQVVKERIGDNLKVKAPSVARDPIENAAEIEIGKAKKHLEGVLNNKLNPGQSPVTETMSFEDLIASRMGDTLKRHLEDPTEGALSRFYLQHSNTNMAAEQAVNLAEKTAIQQVTGRAQTAFDATKTTATIRKLDYAAQTQLWDTLKANKGSWKAPITGEKFLNMSFDDVLDNLPANIGKPYRADAALGKTIKDNYGLFSKPFDELTDVDIDEMMRATGSWYGKDGNRMRQELINIGKSPYALNGNVFYDPSKFGKLIPAKYVFENAGMKADFFDPVLSATMAEEAAKAVPVNKLKAILKPMTKTFQRGEGDASMRKMFHWLDGNKEVGLNQAELKAATEIKELLSELGDEFGIPKSNRISEYIPHIFNKAGIDDASANSFDFSPAFFNKFKQKRLGEPGYGDDLMEALEAYVNVGYRTKYRKNVHEALTQRLSEANLPKHLKDYTENFLNDYGGHTANSSVIEPLVKNLIQSPMKSIGVNIDSHETAQKIARNLLQFGYLTGLGLNFRASTRNYFQRFMVIPRTSHKAYFEAEKMGNKVWSMRYGKNLNDAETLAAKQVMEDSMGLVHRVGDPANLRPDIEMSGRINPNLLSKATEKAIAGSGFNFGEKGNFTKSYLAGIAHEMHKRKIPSYKGLLQRKDYKEIKEIAENVAYETQLIYNRANRPMMLRNMEGPFFMQYGTFGMNMLPLAMKDWMLDHNRGIGMKTMLHQTAMVGGLNSIGLSGAGYAGYYGAVEPIQRLAGVMSGDIEGAVKSPALRGGLGAVQTVAGTVSGSSALQQRGLKNIKSMGNTAIGRSIQEAKNFKDPSRLFLYKPYPKRKD